MLLTAPLGLIGVAIALLVFQVPFGFVANLGVIALFGMIMRNSVILVDQIEQDEKAGKLTWEAIVGLTVRRFRPIMLTAAAAILAMILPTRSVFWGRWRRHHGRADRRHCTHPALPAGAVCRLVPVTPETRRPVREV